MFWLAGFGVECQATFPSDVHTPASDLSYPVLLNVCIFQAKVIEEEKNKAKSDVEAKDKELNAKAEAEKKANEEATKLKSEKVIFLCILFILAYEKLLTSENFSSPLAHHGCYCRMM